MRFLIYFECGWRMFPFKTPLNLSTTLIRIFIQDHNGNKFFTICSFFSASTFGKYLHIKRGLAIVLKNQEVRFFQTFIPRKLPPPILEDQEILHFLQLNIPRVSIMVYKSGLAWYDSIEELGESLWYALEQESVTISNVYVIILL